MNYKRRTQMIFAPSVFWASGGRDIFARSSDERRGPRSTLSAPFFGYLGPPGAVIFSKQQWFTI